MNRPFVVWSFSSGQNHTNIDLRRSKAMFDIAAALFFQAKSVASSSDNAILKRAHLPATGELRRRTKLYYYLLAQKCVVYVQIVHQTSIWSVPTVAGIFMSHLIKFPWMKLVQIDAKGQRVRYQSPANRWPALPDVFVCRHMVPCPVLISSHLYFDSTFNFE